MANLDLLVKAWDAAHWEFSLIFEGLEDADVWKRAHPKLLSVGELAGHVGYWEGVRLSGPGDDNPDLADVTIKSPLINPGFRYYTSEVDAPVVLDLTAQQVLDELTRIHKESKAIFLGKVHDSEDHSGQFAGTWGSTLEYMVFHVSYHAGQAFSVRHIFGHKTNDN